MSSRRSQPGVMRIPVIVAPGPRSSAPAQRELLPGEEEMHNNSANPNNDFSAQRANELFSRLAADKPARIRYYQEMKAAKRKASANVNINGNDANHMNDLEKSLKSHEPILTRKSVRRPGQPSFKVGGILHGQVKKGLFSYLPSIEYSESALNLRAELRGGEAGHRESDQKAARRENLGIGDVERKLGHVGFVAQNRPRLDLTHDSDFDARQIHRLERVKSDFELRAYQDMLEAGRGQGAYPLGSPREECVSNVIRHMRARKGMRAPPDLSPRGDIGQIQEVDHISSRISISHCDANISGIENVSSGGGSRVNASGHSASGGNGSRGSQRTRESQKSRSDRSRQSQVEK